MRSAALALSSISRVMACGVTTGEVMCSCPTPASASASASPSLAQQTPSAPALIWRRAMSADLWVFGMRPQVHLVRLGEGGHLRDVAVEHVEIEHEGRRVQGTARSLLADQVTVETLGFAHFF